MSFRVGETEDIKIMPCSILEHRVAIHVLMWKPLEDLATPRNTHAVGKREPQRECEAERERETEGEQ